jgi:hypothetical protein
MLNNLQMGDGGLNAPSIRSGPLRTPQLEILGPFLNTSCLISFEGTGTGAVRPLTIPDLGDKFVMDSQLMTKQDTITVDDAYNPLEFSGAELRLNVNYLKQMLRAPRLAYTWSLTTTQSPDINDQEVPHWKWTIPSSTGKNASNVPCVFANYETDPYDTATPSFMVARLGGWGSRKYTIKQTNNPDLIRSFTQDSNGYKKYYFYVTSSADPILTYGYTHQATSSKYIWLDIEIDIVYGTRQYDYRPTCLFTLYLGGGTTTPETIDIGNENYIGSIPSIYNEIQEIAILACNIRKRIKITRDVFYCIVPSIFVQYVVPTTGGAGLENSIRVFSQSCKLYVSPYFDGDEGENVTSYP